mgnify:CR=1 FL=1
MSFTVFCNSVNGTKVVGTTNNAVNFQFDFAVATQHKGKFKLGYSFLSQGGMTLTSTDVLYITTNIPMSMENFSASSTTQASKSTILGFINNDRTNSAGTDCYYYKNYTDTSPIIINQVPSGFTTFTVSLFNAITDVLDTKILTNQYSLILNFEAI